jgi:molybdate transport system permease protein
VIASIIANLPFMIQPLQNGFSALNDDLRQASYTMGKSKIVTLFKVLIPNIKKSVITGIALTFAHCIGEFGIVIMVGGNIPKETRIASVAIYDCVQALNFEAANRYAFVLFILSFLILLLIYSINRKTNFTTFR